MLLVTKALYLVQQHSVLLCAGSKSAVGVLELFNGVLKLDSQLGKHSLGQPELCQQSCAVLVSFLLSQFQLVRFLCARGFIKGRGFQKGILYFLELEAHVLLGTTETKSVLRFRPRDLLVKLLQQPRTLLQELTSHHVCLRLARVFSPRSRRLIRFASAAQDQSVLQRHSE